jgi:lauroyl/myristoyl acyltransferase
MLDILLRPDELLELLNFSEKKKEKRMTMLENYIRQMAELLGEPVEYIVNSEPIRKYAEALGLEEYLEYLKRNPGVLR